MAVAILHKRLCIGLMEYLPLFIVLIMWSSPTSIEIERYSIEVERLPGKSKRLVQGKIIVYRAWQV